MTNYMYAWEYEVPVEHEAAFVRAYGPEGDWVRLFRMAEGYRETRLYRDRTQVGRFVTIDLWESEEAWRAFRRDFASQFEAIDARCEALTTRERELGRFDELD